MSREHLSDIQQLQTESGSFDTSDREAVDLLVASAERLFVLAIRAAVHDPAAIPIQAIAAAGQCAEFYVEQVGRAAHPPR